MNWDRSQPFLVCRSSGCENGITSSDRLRADVWIRGVLIPVQRAYTACGVSENFIHLAGGLFTYVNGSDLIAKGGVAVIDDTTETKVAFSIRDTIQCLAKYDKQMVTGRRKS